MPYVNVKITEQIPFRGKLRQSWAYMCPFEDVEVGDSVIVPFGEKNELRRAVVHEVGLPETLQKLATKWVAAHGSAAAHNARSALTPSQAKNEIWPG
jgi:primosomal protein N'